MAVIGNNGQSPFSQSENSRLFNSSDTPESSVTTKKYQTLEHWEAPLNRAIYSKATEVHSTAFYRVYYMPLYNAEE